MQRHQGSFLLTRAQALRVRDEILNRPFRSMVLDFKGVHFATRAFLDELSGIQFFLKQKGIDLHFKNLSSEVQKMNQVVQKRRQLKTPRV